MTSASQKILAGLSEALAHVRGEDSGCKETWFHFVPNRDVAEWEAIGWTALPDLQGSYPGLFSTLCRWDKGGAPVMPKEEV